MLISAMDHVRLLATLVARPAVAPSPCGPATNVARRRTWSVALVGILALSGVLAWGPESCSG